MLRLKAMRTLSLNSSAGGVLYHYTSSMDNVESIVENGLKTSIYPTPKGGYLVGVSLARSKTTVPYAINDTATHGYAFDGEGTEFRRWVYGVIFSKNLLSNAGKIKPYNWVTDTGWDITFNIKPVDSTQGVLPENWLPESVGVTIAVSWRSKDGLYSVAKVTTDFPENTVDADDSYHEAEDKILLKDRPYLPVDPEDETAERYNQTVKDLSKYGMSQKTIFNNDIVKVTMFTTQVKLSEIDSQPAIVQTVLKDGLKTLKRRVKERRSHQQRAKGGKSVKIQNDNAEAVYLDDPDGSVYQELKQDLENLAKQTDKLHIRDLPNSGFRVWGRFPTDISYTELPMTVQRMLSAQGLGNSYESEDRLLVTNVKPGEYIPETREAVIGIIVPRTEYYSDAVNAFKKKHPNIPVYAYKAIDEYEPPKGEIPKEAYRNPIA